METMQAFLGDQPAVRPASYDPAPANAAVPTNMASVAPSLQAASIQNANANAVPDQNVKPAVAPQIGAVNQNHSVETMAHLAMQEMGMVMSRLSEQQYKAIAQTLEAHPVNQKINQEMVQLHQQMATNATVMALGVNTIAKLHLAYPQVPLENIVNDAMNVVSHFKQTQQQPESLQALPSQFMGMAASYVMKYGNPQPLPASPATPVAMAPQGLEQQAKPATVTATGRVHHQGMVQSGQQQAAQLF